MSNKKWCFVGIDTSNYTTSFSLCDENGKVITNIKKLLNVKNGERGLRQSDAVFSHIKNFPEISEDIRKDLKEYDVCAVGVSSRPRDEEGSYMPCFLTGYAVADVLASAFDVPLYAFSHQSGHVMAALYSSGRADELMRGDFAAFHLSGGTTEALYVIPSNDSFEVKLIAGTADINAGQAVDRAGVMMGMSFPCGKELEKYALEFDGKLPAVKTCVRSGRCNLSGIENTVHKIYSETGDKSLVSSYVLEFIGETVEKMTQYVRSLYPGIPIIYAGGVMSNKILQNRLGKIEGTYFSAPEFSSDNASGIALLARKKYMNL